MYVFTMQYCSIAPLLLLYFISCFLLEKLFAVLFFPILSRLSAFVFVATRAIFICFKYKFRVMRFPYFVFVNNLHMKKIKML